MIFGFFIKKVIFMPKTKTQVAQQQQQQQQMQSVLQAQVSRFASAAFRENGCRVYTTALDIAIFLLESYKNRQFPVFDQYLLALDGGQTATEEDLFLIFQQLAHKILGNVQTDKPLPWDKGSLEDQRSCPRADCWFYQLLPLRAPQKEDASVCADLVSLLRHQINALKISTDTPISDPQHVGHTQDLVGAQRRVLAADLAVQMSLLERLGLKDEVMAIQLIDSARESQEIINATYAVQSFSYFDGNAERDKTLHSFPLGGRGPVSGVDEDFLKHFLMTDQGLLQCMVGLNTADLPTHVKFCVNPSNPLELSVLTAAPAQVDKAPQAAGNSPVPPVVLCVPDQKINQVITVQSVFYAFLKKHCYATPVQLMHSLLYPLRSVVTLKAQTQAVEGSDHAASSLFEICSEAVFEEQWALFNHFLGEYNLNFSDLSSDIDTLRSVLNSTTFERKVFNPQHILCFLMEKFRSPNLKPEDRACQFEEVFSTSTDTAGYVLDHLIRFGGRVLEDQVGVLISEMGPMLITDHQLSIDYDGQPVFGWSQFLKNAQRTNFAFKALFRPELRLKKGQSLVFSSQTQLIARFYICVEIQPPACRMPLSFYRQALDIAFRHSNLLSQYEALRQEKDDLDSDAETLNSVLKALGSMLSILAAVSTGPHVKGVDPDQLLEDWTSVCQIFSSLDRSQSKQMLLQGLRAATVTSTFYAQLSSDDSCVEGELAKIQHHLSQFPAAFEHYFEAQVLNEIAESLCQTSKTPTACLSMRMLQVILELSQNAFRDTSLRDLMAEDFFRSFVLPSRDLCVNLRAFPLDSKWTQFESFLKTLQHLPYQQHCDFTSAQQCWDWVHRMAALMPFGYKPVKFSDIAKSEIWGLEHQYPRLMHAALAPFSDDQGFVHRDQPMNNLEAPVLGEFLGILLDQDPKEFNFYGTMSDPVDAMESAQHYNQYIAYMRDVSQSLDGLRVYIFNVIQSACIDVFFEKKLEAPFMQSVEEVTTLAAEYRNTTDVGRHVQFLFRIRDCKKLSAKGICCDRFVQETFQAFKDNVIATLIKDDPAVQARLDETFGWNCVEILNRPEILEIEVSIERSLRQMRAHLKASPDEMCIYETSTSQYLIRSDREPNHYNRGVEDFKGDFVSKLSSIFGIPFSALQSSDVFSVFSGCRMDHLVADHFGLRGNADDFLQSDSTRPQSGSFESRRIHYQILRRCVEAILLKMPEIAVLRVLCNNQPGISPKALKALFSELGVLVKQYQDQAADPSIAYRAQLNEAIIEKFESIAGCQVDAPTLEQVRALTQSIEHLSDKYLDQIKACTEQRAVATKLSPKAAEYVRDIALFAEKAGELNASNLMLLLQNLIGYQLYIVEAKHLQPEEVIIAQQACESLLCSIGNFCKHQDITAIRFDDIEVLLNLSVTHKSMFTVLFESFVMYADKEVRAGASRPLFKNLIDYIQYYPVMSEPKETVKDAVAFLQPTQLSKIEKIELLAFFASQLTDDDRLISAIESAVSALDVAVTTPAYVECLKEILWKVDCLVSQHPHIKGPLVAMLFNIKSDGGAYIDTVSDYLSVLEKLIELDGLHDAQIYTYLALHKKCPQMLIDFIKKVLIEEAEADCEAELEPEPEPEIDFKSEPEPLSRSEGKCRLAVLHYTECHLSRISSEHQDYQDHIATQYQAAEKLLAAFLSHNTQQDALDWFQSCCLRPPYMEHDHLIQVIANFENADAASARHHEQTILKGMLYEVSEGFRSQYVNQAQKVKGVACPCANLDIQAFLTQVNDYIQMPPSNFQAALKDIQAQAISDQKIHSSLAIVMAALARTTQESNGQAQHLNATQVMAVLSMLLRVQDVRHVMAQMDTGEGKSRTMMTLAAVQALLGYVPDFITTSDLLAERDYLNYKQFFQALGIQTALITEDTSESGYLKTQGSVNFSTMATLALHRNQSELSGIGGYVADSQYRCLLLDEADGYAVDTEFNIAQQASSELQWVYEKLFNYFQRDTFLQEQVQAARCDFHQAWFQLIHHSEQWDAILEAFEKSLDDECQEAFKKLSSDRKAQFFKGALQALSLVEGVDYVCSDGSRLKDTSHGLCYTHEVFPLTQGKIDREATFMPDCQEMLVVSVEAKAKARRLNGGSAGYYALQPPAIPGRSTNPCQFKGAYEQSIGITGTASPQVYEGVMVFPREHASKRQDEVPWVVKDAGQQIDVICSRVQNPHVKGESYLIICEDDEKSQTVYDQLSAKLQLKDSIQYLSAQTSSEISKKIIGCAGHKGKITVSSKDHLGRGVDIRPEVHLHVVMTDIFNLEDDRQVRGRAGRQEDLGSSQHVIQRSALTAQCYHPAAEVFRIQYARKKRTLIQERIAFIYQDIREIFELKHLALRNELPDPQDKSDLLSKWMQECVVAFNYEAERDGFALFKEIDGMRYHCDKDQLHKCLYTCSQRFLSEKIEEFNAIGENFADTFEPINASELEGRLNRFMSVQSQLLSQSLDKIAALQKEKTPVDVSEKYSDLDDGHTTVYTSMFVHSRSIISGKRQLFANFRAWWNGRGALFSNLKATWAGDRPLFATVRQGIGTSTLLSIMFGCLVAIIGVGIYAYIHGLALTTMMPWLLGGALSLLIVRFFLPVLAVCASMMRHCWAHKRIYLIRLGLLCVSCVLSMYPPVIGLLSVWSVALIQMHGFLHSFGLILHSVHPVIPIALVLLSMPWVIELTILCFQSLWKLMQSAIMTIWSGLWLACAFVAIQLLNVCFIALKGIKFLLPDVYPVVQGYLRKCIGEDVASPGYSAIKAACSARTMFTMVQLVCLGVVVFTSVKSVLVAQAAVWVSQSGGMAQVLHVVGLFEQFVGPSLFMLTVVLLVGIMHMLAQQYLCAHKASGAEAVDAVGVERDEAVTAESSQAASAFSKLISLSCAALPIVYIASSLGVLCHLSAIAITVVLCVGKLLKTAIFRCSTDRDAGIDATPTVKGGAAGVLESSELSVGPAVLVQHKQGAQADQRAVCSR